MWLILSFAETRQSCKVLDDALKGIYSESKTYGSSLEFHEPCLMISYKHISWCYELNYINSMGVISCNYLGGWGGEQRLVTTQTFRIPEVWWGSFQPSLGKRWTDPLSELRAERKLNLPALDMHCCQSFFLSLLSACKWKEEELLLQTYTCFPMQNSLTPVNPWYFHF